MGIKILVITDMASFPALAFAALKGDSSKSKCHHPADIYSFAAPSAVAVDFVAG